jgi:predicted DNA-binding transcriptional regulator AlpA
MQQAFSKMETDMADSMGIAMYQRFSLEEASLFLRCPIAELERLIRKRDIEYIQVTRGHVDFFGYQLIQYLCTSIRPVSDSSPPPSASPEKILSVKRVIEITGLSRTTIWRLEAKGDFPRRVALSSCRIGWRSIEVEEWLRNR